MYDGYKQPNAVNSVSNETMNFLKTHGIFLKYFGYVVLIVGICIGFYSQWSYNNDSNVLIVGSFSLFLFGVSCALQYYKTYSLLGKILFHLSFGFMYGVISFMKNYPKDDQLQLVINLLFLTGMIIFMSWNVLERFIGPNNTKPKLIRSSDCTECAGLCIASSMTGGNAFPLILMITSVVCHTVSIRTKSFLGFLSFLASLLVLDLTLHEMKQEINSFVIIFFLVTITFPAIIDFNMSNFSALEIWHHTIFQKPSVVRYLLVICLFLINFITLVVGGVQSTSHKEWFVIVPIFVALCFLWMGCHFIVFITCWKWMKKITECNLIFNSLSAERQSLNRVMSSKGVRHFCLLSYRLIGCAIVTTLLLLILGWTTKTGYSVGLIFIVLPIECMLYSIFKELGFSLGGTSVGYAIISPITGQKSDAGVTLYDYSSVQEMSANATSVLSKICQFFDFHMIDNFGTDFSTSGLTLDFLESKVRAFFARRSLGESGPRYDTYLLYLCGDSHESGDLALAGNVSLKLETILEWWEDANVSSGSRLILLVDTKYAHQWVKTVRRINNEFVAIQTCKYLTKTKNRDPENATEPVTVGMFTHDWVLYNMNFEPSLSWSSNQRSFSAMYGLSRIWTDFTFHMPTEEDIDHHCDTSFPKAVKPLVQCVNYRRGFLCGGGSLCLSDPCLRCFRRWQVRWLPPKEIETNHGYKLVRS